VGTARRRAFAPPYGDGADGGRVIRRVGKAAGRAASGGVPTIFCAWVKMVGTARRRAFAHPTALAALVFAAIGRIFLDRLEDAA